MISIDPRRVYVSDPAETRHFTVKTSKPGGWVAEWAGGRAGGRVGEGRVGGTCKWPLGLTAASPVQLRLTWVVQKATRRGE